MDALEFAIKTEHDGERYYRKQAQINAGNRLFNVCTFLADQEKNHAQLLINLGDNKSINAVQTEPAEEIKTIFKDIDNFKSEIRELPSQLEFYTMASEKEQQSIAIYSDLLSKSADNDEKKLFEFLIEQEKQHYDMLEELIVRLSHAEDWVENAEFGLWSNRGEY